MIVKVLLAKMGRLWPAAMTVDIPAILKMDFKQLKNQTKCLS
ncbi:hypothetical protein EV06_0446 [Prochlorococcus sp. MIT 0602]|nr:hypothetical protein EV06_0446 [Prochlorococcus sp. MIT 0602]KGG18424.1 hypothetical protein EV07_0340 [Prochlorococcus sp. MIT 0603]